MAAVRRKWMPIYHYITLCVRTGVTVSKDQFHYHVKLPSKIPSLNLHDSEFLRVSHTTPSLSFTMPALYSLGPAETRNLTIVTNAMQ